MTLACFLLIACLRSADVWLTWRISPDLQYELNPIVRRLGWRWWILANVVLCLVSLRWSMLFWWVCGLTTLAVIWNATILFRLTRPPKSKH